MAAPMNAPLAPYFTLGEGYTVRFAALDAATGDEVTSVVISNATISVDPDTGSTASPDVPKVGPAYFATTEV